MSSDSRNDRKGGEDNGRTGTSPGARRRGARQVGSVFFLDVLFEPSQRSVKERATWRELRSGEIEGVYARALEDEFDVFVDGTSLFENNVFSKHAGGWTRLPLAPVTFLGWIVQGLGEALPGESFWEGKPPSGHKDRIRSKLSEVRKAIDVNPGGAGGRNGKDFKFLTFKSGACSFDPGESRARIGFILTEVPSHWKHSHTPSLTPERTSTTHTAPKISDDSPAKVVSEAEQTPTERGVEPSSASAAAPSADLPTPANVEKVEASIDGTVGDVPLQNVAPPTGFATERAPELSVLVRPGWYETAVEVTVVNYDQPIAVRDVRLFVGTKALSWWHVPNRKAPRDAVRLRRGELHWVPAKKNWIGIVYVANEDAQWIQDARQAGVFRVEFELTNGDTVIGR